MVAAFNAPVTRALRRGARAAAGRHRPRARRRHRRAWPRRSRRASRAGDRRPISRRRWSRRPGGAGLPGAEHRVIDMQAIDLPDATVDGVVCRFGYMLVPDRARACARRGGCSGRAVGSPSPRGRPAKRNPWATVFGPVLSSAGCMEPPAPGEPGQFALGEPEQIERARAGGRLRRGGGRGGRRRVPLPRAGTTTPA